MDLFVRLQDWCEQQVLESSLYSWLLFDLLDTTCVQSVTFFVNPRVSGVTSRHFVSGPGLDPI